MGLNPALNGEEYYLLRVAVELPQDVEERDLRDDQLLLLVFIERRRGQVEGEVEERGLQHLLLVLLLLQEGFFLFCRLRCTKHEVGIGLKGQRSFMQTRPDVVKTMFLERDLGTVSCVFILLQ